MNIVIGPFLRRHMEKENRRPANGKLIPWRSIPPRIKLSKEAARFEQELSDKIRQA